MHTIIEPPATAALQPHGPATANSSAQTNQHRLAPTIRRRRKVSHEEKRRVVIRLLLDEEWTKRSDVYLASIAGVSQPFVSKLRRDLSKKILSVRAPRRCGSDGVLRNTTHIGKHRCSHQRKRDLVFSAIQLGIWTIKELMEEADLTRPSLQAILDEFVAARMITTARRNLKSSIGGRPELLYLPHPNYRPQK